MLTLTANPGFALILAAVAVFASPRISRVPIMVTAAALSLWLILSPPFGDYARTAQIGLQVTLLRLDAMSQMFGMAFAAGAVMMALASGARGHRLEDAAIMLMGGAGMTAVFAGDLISFVAAIELATIAGAWIIFSARAGAAYDAGVRFFIWQGLGGLLLLAGVAFHLADGFGSEFTRLPADSVGGAFFLAGLAIKVAAPIAHVWLKDALANASSIGAAALAVFAAKAGLYGLARGFSGEALLVPAGAAMAVIGALMALADDDIRRAVGYSLIAQMGLIVAAIGVGAPLSLAGAAAHVFTTTLAYGALTLAAGFIAERTGETSASALGGLARAMPLTALFATIAGLSAAAAPGFAGYVSTTLSLEAIESAGQREAWFVLLGASAACAAFAAVRLPVALFFGRMRTAPREERAHSYASLQAMALAAFLCITVGLAPGWLLDLLPPAPVAYSAYAVDRLAPRIEFFAAALFAAGLMHMIGFGVTQRKRALLDVDAFLRGPAAAIARWCGIVTLRVYGGVRAAGDAAASGAARALAAFARATDRPYADGPAGALAALAGALGLVVLVYVFAM
ncbi:MAG: proton-conducting transporter membrane subunit [Hyphomonadaceae bacterium]